MFVQASARLRTQAGKFSSARPQTLSILLRLSVNPETEQQQLINLVESDPVLLTTFLQHYPTANLNNWYEPLNQNHFLFIAVNLAMDLVANPPTVEQWREADQNAHCAMMQSQIALLIARKSGLANVHEAQLTALLASRGDNSLSYVAGLPRDAIRFQHAPLDALKDTQPLIRIVAIASQLPTNLPIPASEHYLQNWGLQEWGFEPIMAAELEDLQQQLNAELLDDYTDELLHQNLQAIAQSLELFHCKILSEQRLVEASSIENEISQLVNSICGLEHCQLFKQSNDGLDCGELSITSTKSIIVKAAREKVIVSSSDSPMIVIDQQLLEQSQCKILLAIPVILNGEVLGVLTAGTDTLLDEASTLTLSVFTDSLARHMASTENHDTISLSLLHRRSKEITHEVSNPFSIIQNYLKILSLKLGDEHDAQKSLKTIASEIQRAAEIVKQYNQIGLNEPSANKTTKCNKALGEVITTFEGAYPQVVFSFVSDETNPSVLLDNSAFKQIFVNLLKNSVESFITVDRVVTPTVEVSCISQVSFPDNTYTEIEVSDNGPGISTELQQNLFDAGISSKSDAQAGLGLGIIKELVTSAGGMISYRTNNNGTAFKILLPQLIETTNQKDSL